MTRASVSLFVLALCSIAGCSSGSPPTGTSGTGSPTDTAFHITGDPESSAGATWSYRGRVDGVDYDLQGILMKPRGTGPFPAVLLSHASDGNAAGYGVALGSVMVQWGLVCIATNYTHASGVPIGAPGGAGEPGASNANILRAHRTYELLRSLSYVDMSRVAAHGHSMGAYVTEALVSRYLEDFSVASHTGGGVRPSFIIAGPAPSPSAVADVRIPYQFHHGDQDDVVALSYEQRFDSILTSLAVPHQFYIYPGEGHIEPSRSPVMLARVRDWYAAHGMF
jgi:dienelactone hydrolase